MGNISIDLDLVNELNMTLSLKLYELDLAISAMNSLRNQLSSNVLKRYSINEQITSINQSIATLNTKITNIIQATAAGAATYRAADYSLYCLFMDITTPTALTANDLAFQKSSEDDFILTFLNWYENRTMPFNVFLSLMNNEDEMMKAIKLYYSGVKFTSDTLSNGKTYLYFKNINNLSHTQVKDLLKNLIGGSENWTDYQIRTFINRGFEIYSNPNIIERGLKGKYINEVPYKQLSGYITNLNYGKVTQFTKEFKQSFKSGIVGDFNYKDWSTLSKYGKGIKIAGTLFTITGVGKNFIENTYIDGEWVFTPRTIVNATTDAAIDLAGSTGAMAVGSAIGSLIAPPIGTVVGFAAGAAVNFAIDFDIADFDGDGEKDSLLDGAKMLVDSTMDAVVDGVENAFNNAKHLVDDAADFLGDIFW